MITVTHEPLEILSRSGSLSASGAHLHVTVSDASGRVYGIHPQSPLGSRWQSCRLTPRRIGRVAASKASLVRMASLELSVPPPVVAAMALPPMWLLARLLPPVEAPAGSRVALALCIAAIGLAFSIAGALAFRRAGTTVNPMRPERATTLVTTGVYRITRNPMYVGLMFALLAWAVFLASPLSLAGPVLFIAYIDRFQIKPEEAILTAKFGSVYEQYKSTARRWL